MNRKEIHFTIDCDGNIESTIQGIKGSACIAIAAEFGNLGSVMEQIPTNEFYQSNHLHGLLLDISTTSDRKRPV